MEKNNMLKIGAVLLGIVMIAGGLWYWSNPEGATKVTSNIILFYGRECTHCKDVEKFLEENKVAEKIQFDRLEVFHNAANGVVLKERAKECGIENEKEIGVPFLYDAQEKKCFIGRPEIEEFFKQKAQLN